MRLGSTVAASGFSPLAVVRELYEQLFPAYAGVIPRTRTQTSW